MVNGGSPLAAEAEPRGRPRGDAAHAALLGSQAVNPFGDLHTLQHLSALFARAMRGVFEPQLRREVRVWAEPLAVERFSSYRGERPDTLTAWQPLKMAPTPGQALMVIDGKFVLELLDNFFGGAGEVHGALPNEFSPAAEAMIARLADTLVKPLQRAWEPLTRMTFTPGRAEGNAALISGFDAEDPVVVTRFGIASGAGKPHFIDILYPVLALKPHAPQLTGKVHARGAGADPAWRNGLTRAAMGVGFRVRAVLAEPVIPVTKLMALKEGDIIPISFGAEVPLMVGNDRLGMATAGAANGRAAVKITRFERKDEGDLQ
ncbi:flagellar motor switch protein FliM [Sphingomonas sp.]|uniref:flagellar motor switch protein FliM n=1 Tax=Sphingomonas sp. TaxID=28214 RepID=UPI001DB31CAA|nr:flagellar motor switch protein FliM [Sphingomonas sp.]MBX9795351.1 flagellar motor switch protein FliM [Sphingomonas sp.]